MEFPIEIGFGEFRLNAHIIFETSAFIIGFRYFLFLKRKRSDPISESNRVWIIIGAAFGAFLFSRLLGSLENPDAWGRADYPWLYFYSSKTIVGGLLGGLFVVEITKYFLNEKSSSGDLFTFPLILAMILGRIGCFTSGVHEPTFGIESTLPFAMDLGDGLMRHPVALYEIIFLVILWIFLYLLEKNNKFENGIRFKFFMIAYLIFRFFIDFIKPTHAVLLTLSSIQLACLGGLIYYARTLLFIFYSPRKLILHAK